MSLRHSTGLKNAALTAGLIAAGFDRLAIYTGAQPANAEAAATGTLLATLTLNATPFKSASGGGTATNGALSTTAVATGTAGWFRFYRSSDTAPTSAASTTDRRLDGTIGTDMTIDNASIVSGGTVQLADGAWTYNHAP